MAAGDKTLLIIEDFITERALWKMLLEKHGYNVLEARDSIQAMKVLKNEKVDLVILDLSIPPAGRDGGFLLLRKKEKTRLNKDTPVIIVSGILPDQIIRERTSENSDVKMVLEKPVENKDLLSGVQQFVD